MDEGAPEEDRGTGARERLAGTGPAPPAPEVSSPPCGPPQHLPPAHPPPAPSYPYPPYQHPYRRDQPSRGRGAPSGAPQGSEPERASLPPVTAPQGWVWLAVAVMGFLGGQVLSALLLYLAAAVSGHLSDITQLANRAVPPAWVVVVELIGLWMGFVGAVVVVSRTQGTKSVSRDMRIGLKPWDLVVGPLVGVAGQLVLLPVLYLPLEPLIPHLQSRLSQPAKHLTGGFPGADLAVIGVLTVLVVPVVEEMFFRGLVLNGFVAVFRRAGRVLGPILACCSTGIVFGLAHFEPLQLLGLAAFGIVLSAMAYKFKRLGPCMLAHGAFNLVAIVVVAFPTGVVH